MKYVYFFLTLATVLATVASPASAEMVFNWEFNTDGAGPDIVTDEVPGSEWWNYNDYIPDPGNNDVAGGVHRFITGPSTGNYYAYNNYEFADEVDYLEINTRMKIYSTAHGNHVGMRLYIKNDVHRAQFAISNTDVKLNEVGPNAAIVADDDFHVYRFVWDRNAPAGEKNKFYMDGELLLQADPQNKNLGTRTGFQYHDATGSGYADWEVDYIRVYDTVVPEPSTVMLLGFGAFALLACVSRRSRK